MQWPLALKSKNYFYSFKFLRTIQPPELENSVKVDVVFENWDFACCSRGGDHYEGYTFMLYYICLGWGHDYNIGS